MNVNETVKKLEARLQAANEELNRLQQGDHSVNVHHTADYIQGRIDALAEAIRYVNFYGKDFSHSHDGFNEGYRRLL